MSRRRRPPEQLRLAGPAVRLQRSRAAGWRIPPGAVYVGRPTRWGNPHQHTGAPDSRAAAAAAYQRLLAADPDLRAAARRLLAGRDLVCWCPPGQPCHADALLAAANTPDHADPQTAGPRPPHTRQEPA